jgi:hypothetical protein
VVKGENRSLASYLKGRGLFIACAGACRPWSNYFINRVELHCQWDPRVRRGSTGLPECFSWFPGAEVDDARVGSWRRHRSGLYLTANPSHVGVNVDGLACPLHHPTTVRRGDRASCQTVPRPVMLQWMVTHFRGCEAPSLDIVTPQNFKFWNVSKIH